MNPLISIIVPVYNAESYVKKCVDSLLSQTYSPIEIVLVNDGSTDSSLNVIRELECENIKVIDKPNGGAASARNVGVDEAAGEFITFVDADDYVSDEYVSVLHSLITKYKADISFVGFAMTSEKLYSFSSGADTRVVNREEMLYRLCNQNKIKETIIPCKLYKRDLLKSIRFPEGMTYEDLASTYKLFASVEAAAESDDILYAYYQSADSVMRSEYSMKNFNSENRAWDERIEFYSNLGNQRLYEHALVSCERNRVANYCKCRKYIGLDEANKSGIVKKFREDWPKVKKSKELSFKDKVLFNLYKLSPGFVFHVLWPLYEGKK